MPRFSFQRGPGSGMVLKWFWEGSGTVLGWFWDGSAAVVSPSLRPGTLTTMDKAWLDTFGMFASLKMHD